MNILALVVAALVPTAIGALWYSKALFGKAWQSLVGLTDEDLAKGNMLVIMLLSLIFSFLLAFLIMQFAVHQSGIYSLFEADPNFATNPEMQALYQQVMESVGDKHRTFGHGALHGGMFGVLGAFSILAINGMFSRWPWKLILIHAGYWVVTMAIMGGIVCVWQ